MVILQLAAIVARLEEIEARFSDPSCFFPHGMPNIPVWLGRCDNSVSVAWENRCTARTPQGQGLVSVFSELCRRRDIHSRSEHLAGELNTIPDDISRNDFSLPLFLRAPKLFKVHPILATLDYFQPSPELLRLLTSQLYSKQTEVPCVLPTVLGRFVPAGCTTFTSVSL